MKKQILLSCGLHLLLLNNLSFSMQSEQANEDSNTQLALRRNEQEEAGKILGGVPAAVELVYGLATKNTISHQPRLQDDGLFSKKNQGSWNILLHGGLGVGKKTLAENIVKYLGMEYSYIRLEGMTQRPPYTHQVDLLADEILPYLSQENSQRAFIIQDIDQLKTFYNSDGDGNRVVYNAERHLRRYIKEAERKNKENKRNNLIFVATTDKFENVSQKIYELFTVLKLGNPGFECRKNLLKNMLQEDPIVDSKECTSDEVFMNSLARNTKGFTISDLRRIVTDASAQAYAKLFIANEPLRIAEVKRGSVLIQKEYLNRTSAQATPMR